MPRAGVAPSSALSVLIREATELRVFGRWPATAGRPPVAGRETGFRAPLGARPGGGAGMVARGRVASSREAVSGGGSAAPSRNEVSRM